MKGTYQIVSKEDNEKLREFLFKNGELILPMVELVEQSKLLVDGLIEALGRAGIEAVLRRGNYRMLGYRSAWTDGGGRWTM